VDLICIPFAFPGLDRVRCFFQTRLAAGCTPGAQPGEHDFGTVVFSGDKDPEEVLATRRTLMRQLGMRHWQECRQVHGDAMIFDPEPAGCETPGSREADGLATAMPGQALVIKTADCQPLLLAHEDQGCVAALHVGWRGNRMGFVQRGVAAFCRHYGIAPEACMAVRGPSLGPGASEFVNFDQEWGAAWQAYYDPQRRTVDLWRLTRDQLLEAGLLPERIFGLDLCTCSLSDYFFSYRRTRGGGRQASFIWLEGE